MNILLVRTVVVVVVVMVGWAVASCPNSGGTFKALTFNTGLEPENQPYNDARTNRVLAALRAESANHDFMCLQEVWFKKDMLKIIEAVKDNMPYSFSAIDTEKPHYRTGAPCTKDEVKPVDDCEARHCPIDRQERWPENNVCMLEKCWRKIYRLPKECRTCGMISTPDLQLCTKAENRLNRPGLLVLSRRPMHNVRYVQYYEGMEDLELVEKGFIDASVETGDNSENIHVACTDLSTDFDFFFDVKLKHDSRYNTYPKMQRHEIDQLDQKLPMPHMLMGSFSTGPALGCGNGQSIRGEVVSNYNYLTTNLGYRNDYTAQVCKCTYCFDGEASLAHTFFFKHDVVVDHIFLSENFPADNVVCPNYARVLDQTGLSDHYGVSLTVNLVAKSAAMFFDYL